jgi:hypothetical protein
VDRLTADSASTSSARVSPHGIVNPTDFRNVHGDPESAIEQPAAYRTHDPTVMPQLNDLQPRAIEPLVQLPSQVETAPSTGQPSMWNGPPAGKFMDGTDRTAQNVRHLVRD